MGRKPRAANKIGRKRRATGWMLLALGVVVAGVWVASGWVGFSYGGSYIHAWCAAGQFGGYRSKVLNLQPWCELYPIDPAEWFSRTPRFGNQFAVVSWDGDSPEIRFAVDISLWPIPLLLCTPAALLLRSGILARRRAMTNACTKCGYSLAGLANDAPCPECGSVSARP